MISGGNALFKSLKPLIFLLLGGFLAFYILNWIIKLVMNWSNDKREQRDFEEFNDLAEDLGYKINPKDTEQINKEKRFKELSEIYKDDYDITEGDDDDDNDAE